MSKSLITLFLITTTLKALKLDNGMSSEKNEYCLKSSSSEECRICAGSYLKEKTCQKPEIKMKNCLEYSSELTCKKCSFGYKVSSSKEECEKITLPYCLMVNNEYECLACEKGIKLKNNSCDPENKIDIDDCLIYSGNAEQNLCIMCKKGYVIATDGIKESVCVETNEDNSNCWYLKENSSECETCFYNYFMDGKSCKKSEEYHVDVFGMVNLIKVFLAFLMFL